MSDELSKQTLINVIKSRCSWNERYVQEIKSDSMYYIPELKHGSNEIFLDGGAYDGDSAKKFIEYVNGKFEKIYCIEPNAAKHSNIINLSCNYENGKIELIPKGLSDKNGEVFFGGRETGYCISENGEEMGIVVAVDTLEIMPTFMKYDIQGEELRALKGAENTIRRCHPRMAIYVYHRTEDLLDISDFILNLNMNYKIVLRHHADDINDTVLYAL